jgi:hypothetical protein
MIEYDQAVERRTFKKADRMLRKYGACLGDMVENMYGYDTTMLPEYTRGQRRGLLKSLVKRGKIVGKRKL